MAESLPQAIVYAAAILGGSYLLGKIISSINEREIGERGGRLIAKSIYEAGREIGKDIYKTEMVKLLLKERGYTPDLEDEMELRDLEIQLERLMSLYYTK